ncbi:hypothetical protein [Dankookia sp. P2]|uniref:hypothetical protein n=1 Tax=Dankookia sp. P2 TaxID=3423955 RepID=UPI003D671C4D
MEVTPVAAAGPTLAGAVAGDAGADALSPWRMDGLAAFDTASFQVKAIGRAV